MTLGERLKALRDEAGLTQEQAGEKLGVHLVTVSRFETGHRVPDARTLQAYVTVFGADPGELLRLASEAREKLDGA